MIIVLDTNVVVSGVLNPYGPPGMILQRVIAGDLTIAYDARILAEYEDVLTRPALGFTRDETEPFLDALYVRGVLATPVILKGPLPDPDDRAFLEVALGGGAQALVTGNLKHFPASQSKTIPVCSPTDFVARFLRNL